MLPFPSTLVKSHKYYTCSESGMQIILGQAALASKVYQKWRAASYQSTHSFISASSQFFRHQVCGWTGHHALQTAKDFPQSSEEGVFCVAVRTTTHKLQSSRVALKWSLRNGPRQRNGSTVDVFMAPILSTESEWSVWKRRWQHLRSYPLRVAVLVRSPSGK